MIEIDDLSALRPFRVDADMLERSAVHRKPLMHLVIRDHRPAQVAVQQEDHRTFNLRVIPQFQGRRRFRIVLEAARIRNPCGKVGKLHIRIVENLSVKHRLPVRRRDSLRRN